MRLKKSRLTLNLVLPTLTGDLLPHANEGCYNEDFGQVRLYNRGPAGSVRYTSPNTLSTTLPDGFGRRLCGRAEWTMDSVVNPGFHQLLASARALHGRFLAAAALRVLDPDKKRTNAGIQWRFSSDRFNLFHIVQARRARKTRRPAKVLTRTSV